MPSSRLYYYYFCVVNKFVNSWQWFWFDQLVPKFQKKIKYINVFPCTWNPSSWLCYHFQLYCCIFANFFILCIFVFILLIYLLHLVQLDLCIHLTKTYINNKLRGWIISVNHKYLLIEVNHSICIMTLILAFICHLMTKCTMYITNSFGEFRKLREKKPGMTHRLPYSG